ncbi:MAG TPA: murein transglycosylase A [Micavibrio sp.]|jgi:membrane-bound lytic murein transglycosylase A
MKKLFSIAIVALMLGLSGCGTVTPSDNARLTLHPASFADLKGWDRDDAFPALLAFQKSCVRILKQPDDAKAFGPDPQFGVYGDWKKVCSDPVTQGRPQAWFEKNFAVWEGAADNGAKEGLFTGYYEAALNGSRVRHGPYQTPLRKRPADLVMVDLGQFRDSLKGQRIAGRVVDGNLKPYEDHRAIDQGLLPQDDALPLAWVDDPVKAFFLQIQGSGQILMDDGTTMRVGYAGQNGHVYYAVGRELVKRGLMDKDDVSMQSIESWLNAHPDQAKEIMYTNPSYVFFQELTGDGPLGGENVPLTPERSLAVDRSKLAYGIPIWIDAPSAALQRLMVAQDTGGAIRGPVRGDIFFGYGERAEAKAGPMKAPGRWWLLLPKQIKTK